MLVVALIPGVTTHPTLPLDGLLAFASLVAVCGGMLLIARLQLGFLGDFLSASVLVGFLSGVGIQVLSGQIPIATDIIPGHGALEAEPTGRRGDE